MLLTHFYPKLHFYTPLKHQETGGFLMFSGGTEVEHWLKVGLKTRATAKDVVLLSLLLTWHNLEILHTMLRAGWGVLWKSD